MPKTIFTLLISSVALISTGLPLVAQGNLNHPTGTAGVFMVDKRGAALHFFNATTLTEESSIKTAINPHDFVFTPDHKLAYVTVYGDGIYGNNPHPGHEIDIVDMAAQKIVGVIDVAPYRAPHGIQIDKKGTLYVTCDLDRKLLVIDPKTKKITDVIDTEGTSHWLTILPDASKAYTSNKTDKDYITVIDLKTHKDIGRIPMPGGTQDVAASPDGKTVVAMSFTMPILVVIDPSKDVITDRIPLKDQPHAGFKPVYSPDGRWLLTLNDGDNVVDIFDTKNLRGEQKVLPTGDTPMGIGFSADGSTALVSNHGEGTVSVIDLKNVAVVKKFPVGVGVETLSYY